MQPQPEPAPAARRLLRERLMHAGAWAIALGAVFCPLLIALAAAGVLVAVRAITGWPG